MYEEGDGVWQDYTKAVKWYRMAAKQGDADAQVKLATRYSEGEGVPQDYGTAHMWLNIAAANGHFAAAWYRDMGAESWNMTAEAISDAQRRARLCMSSGYEACD